MNYLTSFFSNNDASIKLRDAVTRTKSRMEQLKLPVDQFISEMMKHGGVIAGSFMLMNYTNDAFEFGDIDVYFYNDPKYEIGNITNNLETYYHPFEKYLMKTFTNGVEDYDKQVYIALDGILYSRTFTTAYVNINFVLVNDYPIKFINEKFDLDCCKVIFDGVSCTVYNEKDIANGVSNVKYNTYTLEHMYMDGPAYSQNSRANATTIFYNSLAFTKLKLLYDVYLYNNGKLTHFPVHKTYTNSKTTKIPKYHCAIDKIILYTKFIDIIKKDVDLDYVFKHGDGYDLQYFQITGDIIKVVSMIRTLERIEKYRGRGVHTFNWIK